MSCKLSLVVIATGLVSSAAWADEIRGTYVEARTCQVYTGPCFANGEVGLTGKNAVLGWHIVAGDQAGVDLTGLSVAVIVKTSHTLGFRGFEDAQTKKCMIVIDENADAQQSTSLQQFALTQTGLAPDNVLGVEKAPIDLQFDAAELTASLTVGRYVKLKTRKARPGDCICSNESAYYPPLVKLKGSVPGVTIEGDVTARRLGTRWSIPDSRTAFLGLFELNTTTTKLANR